MEGRATGNDSSHESENVGSISTPFCFVCVCVCVGGGGVRACVRACKCVCVCVRARARSSPPSVRGRSKLSITRGITTKM